MAFPSKHLSVQESNPFSMTDDLPRITYSLPSWEIHKRLQQYTIDKKRSLRKQSEVISEALEKFLASEGY